MSRLALTGGAYQARSLIASAQRCLNLYAEPMPQQQGEPSQFAHYPTPGLRLLGTLPQGPVRGIRQTTTGGIYAVGGDSVYLLDPSTWSARLLGTITALRPYPVSMQDNGLNLFIVDGTAGGWTIDLASNSFTLNTDPSFSGADAVHYLDTYFIFNKPRTPQFYISLSLSTAFDSLDFANKESFSDLLVTLAVARREIWLLGERTTEIWFNSGTTSIADFTFQEVQGVFVDHGCAAKYSVAVYDNSIFWLSYDRNGIGFVLQGAGYQTKRVSTFPIETAIMRYPRIDDAIGFVYALGGHVCYVLTFPTADHTWVYNVTTGQWHEWLWVDVNGREHRHRANCAYPCDGTIVLGDWQNGNLYALDADAFTDNGAPIKRQRSFPHLINDSKRVFYQGFVADVETGKAPQTAVAAPIGSTTGFRALPYAPGGTNGAAYAVSADGSTVVGFANPSGDDSTSPRRACYWPAAGGGPVLIGTDAYEAYGVSADGSVIAGNKQSAGPFRWTAAGGQVNFGTSSDSVWGMSADGSRMIGSRIVGSPQEEACYWDSSGARTDLGFLPGHDSSRAMSASTDGSVIVGHSQLISDSLSLRAFRWTAAGGMVDLGVGGTGTSGNVYSRAFGVSGDGTIVVGDTSAPTSGGAVAFSWTAAGGMVLISQPPISANAVSGDGSTIMVYSFLPGTTPGDGYLGYITSSGLTVPTPVALDPADPSTIQGTFPNQNGISADGKTMVGYTFGTHTIPWIYRSTAPAPPAVAAGVVSLIWLDWSDDRGHSYGNPVCQSFGARGRYIASLQWQRLGYARDRVFRLTWSEPLDTALQGAWIDVNASAKS